MVLHSLLPTVLYKIPLSGSRPPSSQSQLYLPIGYPSFRLQLQTSPKSLYQILVHFIQILVILQSNPFKFLFQQKVGFFFGEMFISSLSFVEIITYLRFDLILCVSPLGDSLTFLLRVRKYVGLSTQDNVSVRDLFVDRSGVYS